VGAQLSRHAPRAQRVNFAVTLCIIGILATWLLYSLNQAQSEVEKVILETELNNLRLGMVETWVHKSVTNQPIDIEALKNGNPMQLIAEKPSNYIGERALAPSNNKAIWYFDTQKKQLIYVFSDGHQTAYKLVGTAGQTSASLMSVGGLDLVPDVPKNEVADRNNINNFLD
jgi:hypothetical protein